jgi:hypothetical protein
VRGAFSAFLDRVGAHARQRSAFNAQRSKRKTAPAAPEAISTGRGRRWGLEAPSAKRNARRRFPLAQANRAASPAVLKGRTGVGRLTAGAWGLRGPLPLQLPGATWAGPDRPATAWGRISVFGLPHSCSAGFQPAGWAGFQPARSPAGGSYVSASGPRLVAAGWPTAGGPKVNLGGPTGSRPTRRLEACATRLAGACRPPAGPLQETKMRPRPGGCTQMT